MSELVEAPSLQDPYINWFGRAARTEIVGLMVQLLPTIIPFEIGGYIGDWVCYSIQSRLMYVFHVKLELSSNKHVAVWLINDSASEPVMYLWRFHEVVQRRIPFLTRERTYFNHFEASCVENISIYIGQPRPWR